MLRKRSRFIFAAVLFYVITLSPVLAFSGNETSFMSDRFLYVSSFAFSMPAAYVLHLFAAKHRRQKTIAASLAVLYLLALSIQTFSQCKVWRDSETLWTHVIKHYPQSYTAHTQRANVRLDNNEPYKALEDLNRSVAIKEDQPKAYYNRGLVFFRLGHTRRAADDFSAAISLDSSYYKAYYNRAVIRFQQKKYRRSLQDLDKTLILDRKNSKAYFKRGVIKYHLGQKTAACEDWRKAAAFGKKQARKLLIKYCK